MGPPAKLRGGALSPNWAAGAEGGPGSPCPKDICTTSVMCGHKRSGIRSHPDMLARMKAPPGAQRVRAAAHNRAQSPKAPAGRAIATTPMADPVREIIVAPDRFEVTCEDAILAAEAVLRHCHLPVRRRRGALLHLRCMVHGARQNDAALASALALLERCLLSMRQAAPRRATCRRTSSSIWPITPNARESCDTVLSVVRQLLADAGVRLLPTDFGTGLGRTVRFRPSMGWVQVR